MCSVQLEHGKHLQVLQAIRSVGVGVYPTQFLSNRSQYIEVDGCRSKLANVVSSVPQGKFGSAVVPLVHSGPFVILEHKLTVMMTTPLW